MNLSAINKAILNVVTAVVTATPWILNAMHQAPFQGTATATIVSSLLGLVGVIAHYAVPNTTTNAEVAATSSVKLVSPASKRRTV